MPGPEVNHVSVVPSGTLPRRLSVLTHAQPDPLVGSNAVIVVGKQVLNVNSGSNTFSVFDIDAADPANPKLAATYPSYGEFPNSLGASADGKTVCVLNAGKVNGFACYGAGANGWSHLSGWDRNFGLNLTTPPMK